jgi:hypothetical protein
MIAAIFISNACLILMSKGVPDWLYYILWFAYAICNIVAMSLWESMKERVKKLAEMSEGK